MATDEECMAYAARRRAAGWTDRRTENSILADLGAPRSYRDRRDLAMEAARLIKSKNPHRMVEVKDLQSGDVTAAALRPG
jgi:hypothetical protein